MLHIMCGYVYLLGYANDLMVKAAELCLDDHDKPDLPTAPSPLANITNILTKTPYLCFLDINNNNNGHIYTHTRAYTRTYKVYQGCMLVIL